MNLFDRFARVVKSDANVLISSFENSKKILEQTVLEINDDLTKMCQAIAQVSFFVLTIFLNFLFFLSTIICSFLHWQPVFWRFVVIALSNLILSFFFISLSSWLVFMLDMCNLFILTLSLFIT